MPLELQNADELAHLLTKQALNLAAHFKEYNAEITRLMEENARLRHANDHLHEEANRREEKHLSPELENIIQGLMNETGLYDLDDLRRAMAAYNNNT